MPLWQIYHPVGAFDSESSKQAFVDDITAFYTGLGLPPFYVITQFFLLQPSDFYYGGKQNSKNPFVRIVVNHIASTVPKRCGRRRLCQTRRAD